MESGIAMSIFKQSQASQPPSKHIAWASLICHSFQAMFDINNTYPFLYLIQRNNIGKTSECRTAKFSFPPELTEESRIVWSKAHTTYGNRIDVGEKEQAA
jgi:hypothetical protein